MRWEELSPATQKAITADLRQATEAIQKGARMLADVNKRMEEDKGAS